MDALEGGLLSSEGISNPCGWNQVNEFHDESDFLALFFVSGRVSFLAFDPLKCR